jgi:HD-GYP domain-containing protein (c-di-GMP phosphodiesterase class II)
VDDLAILPERSAAQRAEMKRRVGAGEKWEDEIEIRDAHGRMFPALVTNAPVHDHAGGIIGYVGVMVDVSAKHKAEQELHSSRLETIRRLARAVEMRDIETGGHIERIGLFAAVIGERLELGAERVEMLRIASPMHDVGKIGIPDSVLLKPGKLTSEEMVEMQRHAEIGHELLMGSGSEMLELAAIIALTHHEWVDGSGYPRGLKGEAIPLEGRIVAVADVFDALTSDRVYRPAFGVEQATEMMAAERGTHFDPAVLDALLGDLKPFLDGGGELGADSSYRA